MEEKNTRPAWMEDELVRSIAPAKLDFLNKLFIEGHGRNRKEMLSYLAEAARRARKDGLSFTPQEMNDAIRAIRKHSTQEELHKIDQILARQNNKKG